MKNSKRDFPELVELIESSGKLIIKEVGYFEKTWQSLGQNNKF